MLKFAENIIFCSSLIVTFMLLDFFKYSISSFLNNGQNYQIDLNATLNTYICVTNYKIKVNYLYSKWPLLDKYILFESEEGHSFLEPFLTLTFFSVGVLCFSELSFITEPSDVTVLPKDPVVLDCQAHGQPPVTIKWLKNGVKLTENEHLKLLPNGSLFIPKIKHTKEDSDEGVYQCLSQNRYGAILSQRSRLTIASECPFLFT